jgi:competence protein ComEA
MKNGKKLGLRDKTIQTIGHYLSKGGKFHKPDDLKKIYGLSEEKYDQLLPHIQFKNADTVTTYKKAETNFVSEPFLKKGKTYSTININTADTSVIQHITGNWQQTRKPNYYFSRKTWWLLFNRPGRRNLWIA